MIWSFNILKIILKYYTLFYTGDFKAPGFQVDCTHLRFKKFYGIAKYNNIGH